MSAILLSVATTLRAARSSSRFALASAAPTGSRPRRIAARSASIAAPWARATLTALRNAASASSANPREAEQPQAPQGPPGHGLRWGFPIRGGCAGYARRPEPGHRHQRSRRPAVSWSIGGISFGRRSPTRPWPAWHAPSSRRHPPTSRPRSRSWSRRSTATRHVASASVRPTAAARSRR